MAHRITDWEIEALEKSIQQLLLAEARNRHIDTLVLQYWPRDTQAPILSATGLCDPVSLRPFRSKGRAKTELPRRNSKDPSDAPAAPKHRPRATATPGSPFAVAAPAGR